jgi:23S rRNA pseudouridine2605 synthase
LSVERLQKILSQAGIASRRASEQLIVEGRVTVNGTTIRELGTKADPSRDDIRVDGSRIKLPDRHRYLLLNKPRGYVTTRSDPHRRPTVMDLLGGVREYVYPVGRLDFESEGLLLLTNDGELAAQLTHPSHGVARVYEVRVLGSPDAHDVERLARGVTIDGRRTQPAEVEVVPSNRPGRQSTMRITVREGRNRQVRKMFEAIGHPVDELRRVAIGPLRDSRLKSGYWRDLTGDEVALLKKIASRISEPARPAPARPAAPSHRPDRPVPPDRPAPSSRPATTRRPRATTHSAGPRPTDRPPDRPAPRMTGPRGARTNGRRGRR